MRITTALANAIINLRLRGVALTEMTGWISLHNDLPGDTGANEVSGGSYGRLQPSVAAPAGGSADSDADLEFADMPADTIVAVCVFDAQTVGTAEWCGPLTDGTAGLASADAGTDALTAHSHGLVDDDRVALDPGAYGSLPGGLNDTTLYFVVGAAADTFQVSLTEGGAAIDITSDGFVNWTKVTTRETTAGSTFRISAGDLSFTIR